MITATMRLTIATRAIAPAGVIMPSEINHSANATTRPSHAVTMSKAAATASAIIHASATPARRASRVINSAKFASTSRAEENTLVNVPNIPFVDGVASAAGLGAVAMRDAIDQRTIRLKTKPTAKAMPIDFNGFSRM